MMEKQPPPKQIYLQAYDSDFYDDNTWCVDRINDEDIEYILQSEYDQLKSENEKQKIAIANQGKIINQYQKQSTDLQYELDTIKNNPEAEKYYFEKWTELKQRIVELEEALTKIARYQSLRFRLSPYEYGLLEQIIGIAEHALRDGE